MKNETFTDSNKVERIGRGHPEIGKHMIEVSKVIDHEHAVSMCENLNNMPSSMDKTLFQVFWTKERIPIAKGKDVPGFIIRRKVIVNDKVQWLEKLDGKKE